jgi:hypothetical protein
MLRMTTIEQLSIEFTKDMWNILDKEVEEGYHSSRFREMLERYKDGVEVAKRLLDREPGKDTFSSNRRKGKLYLTMEYYVVLEKYKPLFDESQREIAEFRLRHGD